MGTVREETITDTEKKITAYHEAGHALVARELPGADPIYKVSIIPRGMAMGVTQLLPEEDRHYYPRAYLMNKLVRGPGRQKRRETRIRRREQRRAERFEGSHFAR